MPNTGVKTTTPTVTVPTTGVKPTAPAPTTAAPTAVMVTPTAGSDDMTLSHIQQHGSLHCGISSFSPLLSVGPTGFNEDLVRVWQYSLSFLSASGS